MPQLGPHSRRSTSSRASRERDLRTPRLDPDPDRDPDFTLTHSTLSPHQRPAPLEEAFEITKVVVKHEDVTSRPMEEVRRLFARTFIKEEDEEELKAQNDFKMLNSEEVRHAGAQHRPKSVSRSSSGKNKATAPPGVPGGQLSRKRTRSREAEQGELGLETLEMNITENANESSSGKQKKADLLLNREPPSGTEGLQHEPPSRKLAARKSTGPAYRSGRRSAQNIASRKLTQPLEQPMTGRSTSGIKPVRGHTDHNPAPPRSPGRRRFDMSLSSDGNDSDQADITGIDLLNKVSDIEARLRRASEDSDGENAHSRSVKEEGGSHGGDGDDDGDEDDDGDDGPPSDPGDDDDEVVIDGGLGIKFTRVNGDDLERGAYHQAVGFQRLVILMIFRYTLNTANSSEDIKTFLKNRYFEEPWEALETQILKATKHLFRRSWDPRVYDAIATMPDFKIDFVSHYEGCDACGRRLANANTYRDVVISGRVYDRRTLLAAGEKRERNVTLGNDCFHTFTERHAIIHCVYHAFNTFIRDAFDDLAEEEHHTFQRYRDRQDIIDVDEIVVRLERDWAEQCDHLNRAIYIRPGLVLKRRIEPHYLNRSDMWDEFAFPSDFERISSRYQQAAY